MARVLHSLILFGVYFCAASTAAQAIGLGRLYSHGGLTPDKIRQYAAVLYGLDLLPPAADSPEDTHAEGVASLSRSARLAALGEQYPLCERRKAMQVRERTVIEQSRGELQTRQREHDQLKKHLDSVVAALETEAEATALAETQQTLESLQPAQTKAILLRMLSDRTADPQKPLAEVAGILQAMTSDKLKKILGEFKSDTERATLQQILAHIGQLGATPVEEPPP